MSISIYLNQIPFHTNIIFSVFFLLNQTWEITCGEIMCAIHTFVEQKYENSTSNKNRLFCYLKSWMQTMEPSVRKCQHNQIQTNVHYDNTT